MFWRFNNMCTTNIDNLLNDEDVTLQRLMDEDDIIQECKSSNRKLINFLVKTEVLHELVSLVTKEPSTQAADAVRFKYNNIAAELLSCDISVINDAIVMDESLLTELCQFIYNEPPLNPLMASFFSKTMAVLVGRKADKMLEYLKTKEEFLTQLLKHLRTSAIMDLVLKLVTCVENKNSRLEIAQWLYSEHFVENLLGLLSGRTETDLHGNAAQLLCDLLRLLRDMHAQNVANEINMEQQQGESVEIDPILCALESKAMVDLLLANMLDSELGESSIVHGITVLLTLLEVRRPPQLLSSEPEVFDRMPPEPIVTPCIRNTVEAIIPRLKDFHQILSQPPKKQEVDVAIGGCNKPFGFVRLQVTRLIAALIATGSSEVQKELTSLETFSLLLDMMVEFSHNNFLHAQVERSIQYVLGLEPIELLQPSTQSTVTDCSETETRNESEQPTSPTHPLLSHLMKDVCIVRRIMDAWELNDQHQNQEGGLRRAYMGHLIRIANYVADFGKQGKNSAKIQQLLQDLVEEMRDRWFQFVETKVAPANRNNEIIPVTSHMVAPRVSSDEEESDLIRHSMPKDTAAQEVFAEYQMEVMSKHIVTQFAFADTQFNDNDDQLRPPPETLVNIALPEDGEELTQQSELFEQVCNERMQARQKTQEDEDVEVTDTWAGSARSSENSSTVRQESSSDEDETIADATNDSMDIDNLDRGDQAIAVAADASNPWENAPAAPEEDNWANFSKADFDNASSATPMEISDSPGNSAVTDDFSPFASNDTNSPPEDRSDQPLSTPEQTNGPV